MSWITLVSCISSYASLKLATSRVLFAILSISICSSPQNITKLIMLHDVMCERFARSHYLKASVKHSES